MNDYIEYAIPTNSDYWTTDDNDVPVEFFERIEREMEAWFTSHWPDIEFSTRRVPENTSYTNRSRTSFNDDDGENYIAAIDDWLSTRWPDWLSEYVDSVTA